MRMWEIREGDYSPKHRGYSHQSSERGKDRELKEAYECGYEDGYEDAMREVEGHHSYNRMKKY